MRGRRSRVVWPAAAILLAAAALLGGCPRSPDDTFAITFANDTGRVVVLNLCGDSRCHDFDYSDKLGRGQSIGENISTDVFTRWTVTDGTGRRLGCLPFSYAVAYVRASARLSQMVGCPGDRSLRLAGGSPEHP